MTPDNESTIVRRMTLAQLVRRFNHQKAAGIAICNKDLKYELRDYGYTLEDFKKAQSTIQ